MPSFPVLDIPIALWSQAISTLLILLVVFCFHPRRTVMPMMVRPRFFAHTPRPSLPEGHNWPDWHDSHDGVFEKWVCRDCGVEHLRRAAD